MISRREFLRACAWSAALPGRRGWAQANTQADHRLVITPVTWELSPRHTLKTIAYGGQVSGPLLRFKEGRPVVIEVSNQTSRPDVVHWHGLHLPSAVDGALEEGTAPIMPGSSARYAFTPRPAGFRWYHTHTMAMNDLTLAQYGGQHGFLIIEPRENPARYDREFFIALHDWEGRLQGSGDGAMNPVYAVSTMSGRTLGFGEPLRVNQGERVLLHVLNSSPTEVHWVSLAGHDLRVVALDGNPVPNPRAVPMLRLAPAEHVCALVEMNNPGMWILGEVRKHVQAAGMGMVVEYANRSGPPQWRQPPALEWTYADFASAHSPAPPDEPAITVPLIIESKFRGHGSMESWTLNGRSYPDAGVDPLQEGRRYRLQFINRSMDDHPLHLHRHGFELRTLNAPLGQAGHTTDAGRGAVDVGRGLVKDVVLVGAQACTEVEFTADNPGKTLLHCHQQNHMDLGFMMLLDYV
jgi:FtsP/CotA-like multicopper oxidase with cupredoxin domain